MEWELSVRQWNRRTIPRGPSVDKPQPCLPFPTCVFSSLLNWKDSRGSDRWGMVLHASLRPKETDKINLEETRQWGNKRTHRNSRMEYSLLGKKMLCSWNEKRMPFKQRKETFRDQESILRNFKWWQTEIKEKCWYIKLSKILGN